MTTQSIPFSLSNTNFYGQIWRPDQPKAIIVLVHGMGEHAARYEEFVIPFLVKNNFALFAFDQFGHGRTSGKRGHNPGYEAVLNSVSVAIEKATELVGSLPVFLYGHSMGGNVVLNYCLSRGQQIQGVVATSPFLRLAFEPPAWKLTLGKLMQNIAPSITLGNELDPNLMSRDPKEVQKYIDDPMVHDRVSPNYSLTFIQRGAFAIEKAKELQTPALLAHGTEDQIIDPKGSIDFAANAPLANVKLYEGGYHELQHDLCKETVLSDILTWLNSQLN